MRILYLSYDGMTDPLGQSQVLPYLMGLSGRGHRFTLISFEKKKNDHLRAAIQKQCLDHHINWVPLPFSTTVPLLSKVWDVWMMWKAAKRQLSGQSFQIVHCRSYISAWVARQLKRRSGFRLLFDMRGFWIDERAEGGLWNLKNPFYRAAFAWAKRQEAQLLRGSDGVIALTAAALPHIDLRLGSLPVRPLIEIIRCSADPAVFALPEPQQREQARKKLGIEPDELAVCYLGSVATWYLVDEMMEFFKIVKERFPNARLLFLTPADRQTIVKRGASAGLNPEDVITARAARDVVPQLLAAADVGLMFIKPTFSKVASSPTKLAEMLLMGIPVVCNRGIGDVEKIVDAIGGGLILPETTQAHYRDAARQLPHLLKADRSAIRKKSIPFFDLETAVNRYQSVYTLLVAEQVDHRTDPKSQAAL